MNPRKIGPILGIIAAIYLSVILTQAVTRNYDLQQQVGNLEADITKLENTNQELQYQAAYYKTDAYKEKEARAKLGLQAPGENVIVLPADKPAPEPTEAEKKAKQKPNWQQWKEFLFG